MNQRQRSKVSAPSSVVEKLGKRFGDAITFSHADHADQTVIVDSRRIVEIVTHLKTEPGLEFDMLTDLCGVDYLPRRPRFEVVYHLYSLKHSHRLRVKAQLDGDQPEVESITSLYLGANWFEREVWDMFGIRFRGHPDLRRILLYEEFAGHPLRRDYPFDKRQPIVEARTRHL